MAFATLLTLAACSQNGSVERSGLNHPAGQYPGNPAEDFSPMVRRSQSIEYRNLALLRPAYHSSSYDYNLTAQLVTDGIVTTDSPWWISVIGPEGEISKQQREYLLDGMPWSAIMSGDKSVTIQVNMPHHELVADEVHLRGRLTLPKGQRTKQQASILTSHDGENWQTLDTNGTNFVGEDSGRDKSGVTASYHFDLSAKLNPADETCYLKFELSADAARYWEVTNLQFYSNGEELSVMPSEHFCSAWRSATAGEEWVYVDLGDSFSFDKVQLNWINRAQKAMLQVSDNAQTWKDLCPMFATEGLTDELTVKGQGRYVRLLCQESANGEPYELSEMQVMGRGGMEVVPQTSWRLQRASEVEAKGEEISTAAFDASSWLPATVPGTVLTSYLKAGALPDPNYRDNQLMISESFFNSDFWYRAELDAEEITNRTFLNFDGINWKADVYLNGSYVNRIEGAFKQARFDVTDIVREGKNQLAVRIIKNAHPGRVKEQDAFTAESNGGHLGADNATFHASIGWDWIPTVRGRNIGIWNDVYLTHKGNVTIDHPLISSVLPQLPDTTVAEVTASLCLHNHSAQAVQGTVIGSFGDITFSREVELQPNEQRLVTFDAANTPALRIDQPHLWWPNGYGEPYLYDFNLRFENGGKISDQCALKSGIRQMTWSDDPYEAADVKPGSFGTSKTRLSLNVNGRRFVGFGGNWGLAEHNLNYRAREYDAAVRYHRDMNFTIIRNWVGQIADDEFYEACDRYGIMVWQDFWLANPYDGPDPYYQDLFMDNAEDLVCRIRNHPSIALYVGRNEGYPPAELDKALRSLVDEKHPGMHYIPHSAAEVVSGGGPYRTLPVKEYFSLFGIDRFHSERGMPCIPNYESMGLFMSEDDMWPINTNEHPNSMYGLHDYCLQSAQRTETFNQRFAQAFGEPTDARQFAELSQWLCYDGYRAIFESRGQYRRGLLLWMSHPSWPSFVWQTYDYYFDPTAAYFACKKACEPLHIQWNAATDDIEVVNYRAGNHTQLKATAELLTQEGESKWQLDCEVSIDEDQTSTCFTLPTDETTLASLTETYFVRLKLLNAAGEVVSENFYCRGKEEGNFQSLLSLPKAKLKVENDAKLVGDEWQLTARICNDDNVPALMVHLVARGEKSNERVTPVIYSDNYFNLMPGESKLVQVSVKVADCNGQKPVITL